MNQRCMNVSHSKYGPGYVYVISDTYLVVRFKNGKEEDFPPEAMEDGTLKVTESVREQFKERYEDLLKRAAAGRQ